MPGSVLVKYRCQYISTGAGDAGIQCKRDSSFKDLGIWPHRETASTLAITGQSDKCYENKGLMGQ